MKETKIEKFWWYNYEKVWIKYLNVLNNNVFMNMENIYERRKGIVALIQLIVDNLWFPFGKIKGSSTFFFQKLFNRRIIWQF